MNPIVASCWRLSSGFIRDFKALKEVRILLRRRLRRWSIGQRCRSSTTLLSLSLLSTSGLMDMSKKPPSLPQLSRGRRRRNTYLNFLYYISLGPRFFFLLLIWFPLLLLGILSRHGLVSESLLIRLILRGVECSGPIFIKLGQWASSRRDLFPSDLCDALRKLQSSTKPHSWCYTEKVLCDNYGHDYMDTVFDKFDSEVLGSGCCAQVYRAKVRECRREEGKRDVQVTKDVAVKVLHPNIQDRFDQDLRVMSMLVEVLLKFFPDLKWLSLQEGLDEFAKLMQSQLDLRIELEHLEMFRRNFANYKQIVFPTVVRDLSNEDILVESFEPGLPISSYLKDQEGNQEKEKQERGVVRTKIANMGVDMMLKMIFVDNLVHGDLHPGNILVRYNPVSTQEKGLDLTSIQLVILDPGIVSRLSESDLNNLAAVFKAVVKGEARRVGELFLERSKHTCKSPEIFINEMEAIVKEALEQLRDSRLLTSKKIEAAQLLNQVFKLLVRHEVKLESSFASIILAIMVLEGLGRSLDPKIDLITKAFPYVIKTRNVIYSPFE